MVAGAPMMNNFSIPVRRRCCSPLGVLHPSLCYLQLDVWHPTTSTSKQPGEQELLELKQRYVKATGTAYGPAPDKKKGKKDKDSQPKQMDTRKADKAKKVSSASLTADINSPIVVDFEVEAAFACCTAVQVAGIHTIQLSLFSRSNQGVRDVQQYNWWPYQRALSKAAARVNRPPPAQVHQKRT